MPNLVMYLNQTLVFEWYVIWHGFKYGHQKDPRLNQIELRAQNMSIVVGSIINEVGRGRKPI